MEIFKTVLVVNDMFNREVKQEYRKILKKDENERKNIVQIVRSYKEYPNPAKIGSK